MKAAMEKLSRHDAYRQWQDAAVNVSALQHWVIGKCLERYQRASETGKRFHEIDDDELALVNTALSAAVEGIDDLRYDMQRRSLLADWRKADGDEQKTVSFEHLSDGQRGVICLVADIARRICLLNPQLGKDVIRQTPGVVLIDELDAHLHPHWQRCIVSGLKAAFPKVQFIATSHSPQVLGELQPEEIILLREGGASQPQVSYGLDSSQVLEEIMGASSRNLEVEEKLERLFVEIENKRLTDAKRLLGELKKSAPRIPELGRADALIRRKEVIGR
jgi:predicted ATP-binding protein involved in virulence